jgi:hypothetical protein
MSMTYQQAMAFLAKAKCTNTGRPVAHKTRMQLHINTTRPPHAALVFHNTCIVEWTPNKTVFTNGGYMTQTTKSRLNDYLPSGYHINQVKGEWVLTNPEHMVKKWLPNYFVLKFTPEGELMN